MRLHPLGLLLTLPLLLGACRDSKVAVYRIPKEIDTPVPAASPHAGMAGGGDMSGGDGAVARADGPGLSWTVPAGWQSKGPSGVRKDTLVVAPDAELAVTAFPGDVGGELANINRWRGQLQVAPIGEGELDGSVTRLDVNGLKVGVVDIAGGSTDKPARMLGAFVPVGGATWFFKLIGPDTVVAGEKAKFLAFLQTLKADASTAAFGSAHGSAGEPPPPAAAPTAPADMANTEVIKAEGPGLRWTAPAHWESRPAAAMRKATYAVPNPAGAAGDLSITAFPGDVGGEVANLNRWRNQLQLPPLAPGEVEGTVTRLAVHGLNLTVADYTGGPAGAPVRMLGAIVPFAGSTWFFKLTGPVDLVAKEKPAFEAFLQTLSAP
ncbi:MAG: hypothetical protein JSR48_15705 [Verrucomicrobia bacterium]|nr:hypothetical protein [Verrucomicrobiota bacterium]